MRLLVANWKMAPETPAQAKILTKAIAPIVRANKKNLDFIICPPTIHLSTVAITSKALTFGGQDVSFEIKPSSTGQISSAMLASYGARYCIVGHSECRQRGDSNEIVKLKIDRLMEKKIQPILCVGEKSRDLQGWYLGEIKDQIESAFFEIPKIMVKKFIIAYEPIWAIGEGAKREATPLECLEMVIYIRKLLTDLYDEKTARAIPVLYGGSVNEINASLFMNESDIAGLLVGRASLVPKQFEAIAKSISLQF